MEELARWAWFEGTWVWLGVCAVMMAVAGVMVWVAMGVGRRAVRKRGVDR